MVDTDGRRLMVNLPPADVQDAAGAEQIIKAIRKRWPWLKHLFADGAYERGKLGPVDIHRVARTMPTRWIMALKLSSVLS